MNVIPLKTDDVTAKRIAETMVRFISQNTVSRFVHNESIQSIQERLQSEIDIDNTLLVLHQLVVRTARAGMGVYHEMLCTMHGALRL